MVFNFYAQSTSSPEVHLQNVQEVHYYYYYYYYFSNSLSVSLVEYGATLFFSCGLGDFVTKLIMCIFQLIWWSYDQASCLCI